MNENQQSPEGTEENTLSSQGRDFSKMEQAFGAPFRPKIKRVRSSFHLDEKWLKEWKENKENDGEKSPTSDVVIEKEEKSKTRLEPQQIIKQAFREIVEYGSSTSWVLTIEGTTVKIANIGDSTMMIVRFNFGMKSSRILLKTEEQQHNFNAPFQLANIPDNLKPLGQSGNSHSEWKRKFWKDKVSDAVLYQTCVKEGDIIIGGTDGLFDNLYPKEITNIIDIFFSECLLSSSDNSLESGNTFENTPQFTAEHRDLLTKENAKSLAHELVKEARRKSKNKSWLTPFAERFDKTKSKKGNEILTWRGGKPDDICAVVGFVKKHHDTFSLGL